MPIIGNKDIVTFTSKYNISSGGVVTRQTGSDSFFTKATVAGDSINYAGQEYVIASVDSATQVTVDLEEFGGSITGATGATVFVQQKPKYVKFITDKSSITGRSDVYGVSTGATGTFSPQEQQAARGHNNHPQHAGWVRHKNGYGPVSSVTITNGGWFEGSTGPVVSFSTTVGATGVLVATGVPVYSSLNGGLTVSSVQIIDGGLYTTTPYDWSGGVFTNPVTVTMAKVGATGIAATGTVNLGGRFGRNLNETLVAFKNITNDASDDTVFPDS
jgi:hypothetical protein